MQNFFNVYVSNYSDYEGSRYANYIYENKTINNTLDNANRNASSAEGHLEMAIKYQENGNEIRFKEECHSATEDAINATEKYLKVVANMKGVELNKFRVLHGNSGKTHEEIVRNTHIIGAINEAIKEDSIFSEEEIVFLDGFIDRESGCFTSHTELAYGNIHPTLDDAEKAVKYMNKARRSTKEFRKKVYASKVIGDI